ncbi:type VI secretion system baseplate subunit TssF [Rugamonas rubra]|uniref:Type VI secretion system protein ImpG n=1 Tax=Rugamonas rubra TaxID=758825 RepID=A0A1I4JDG0_9BURK|nr:type VI secretion system baseplate subunit TssF [Rugamonas rubra]SFL64146.1 type VI secretion system protein ImpG [Rugamonas rubra]
MKHLVPFIERELSLFGKLFRRFAEEFPGVAGDLKLNGEGSEDPQVRMLTQATAILNARIAKKLDDDYEEVTTSFLQMAAPHLLLPFPACSIACFAAASDKGKSAGSLTVARGTMLKTPARRGDGGICKFRTAYPVRLTSATVAKAHFTPSIAAPVGTRLGQGATSAISIVVEWASQTAGTSGTVVETLRLFIDSDPAFCAALLDALFLRTESVYVEVGDGRWHLLDKTPLAPVGFDAADEALIPFPAKSKDAYRLLTEYFCFPAKFNFIDIALAACTEHLPPGGHRLTLHFALAGVAMDSPVARLLKPLSEQHFLSGCTPVVNLFKQTASPIKLDHTKSEYTLVADPLHADTCQLYSVDSVHLIKDAAKGNGAVEFRPYYSLRHGDDAGKKVSYWIMRRDDAMAVTNQGYENILSFVDVDFNPLAAATGTISIELTCSNGELPRDQDFGQSGGAMFVDASIGDHRLTLLRRPSPPCPPATGRNAQWKLASHLALSTTSLSQEGLPAFREMLAMHDLPRSATARRQIDGIVGLETRPARVFLQDEYGGAFVSGIEVRMTIDETAFAGSGIHVFVQLMDHFMSMSVHLNSFTQLIVLSQQSEKELVKCQPRHGNLSLV